MLGIVVVLQQGGPGGGGSPKTFLVFHKKLPKTDNSRVRRRADE